MILCIACGKELGFAILTSSGLLCPLCLSVKMYGTQRRRRKSWDALLERRRRKEMLAKKKELRRQFYGRRKK